MSNISWKFSWKRRNLKLLMISVFFPMQSHQNTVKKSISPWEHNRWSNYGTNFAWANKKDAFSKNYWALYQHIQIHDQYSRTRRDIKRKKGNLRSISSYFKNMCSMASLSQTDAKACVDLCWALTSISRSGFLADRSISLSSSLYIPSTQFSSSQTCQHCFNRSSKMLKNV